MSLALYKDVHPFHFHYHSQTPKKSKLSLSWAGSGLRSCFPSVVLPKAQDSLRPELAWLSHYNPCCASSEGEKLQGWHAKFQSFKFLLQTGSSSHCFWSSSLIWIQPSLPQGVFVTFPLSRLDLCSCWHGLPRGCHSLGHLKLLTVSEHLRAGLCHNCPAEYSVAPGGSHRVHY